MLRAPGRNADAVAEMAVGLLFAVNRGDRPRRPRRARGRDVPRRHDPLPALPGLAARRPDRRASSGSARWAGRRRGGFEGLGMKVISYDPFAPDATHSLDDLLAEADVVSMHAAVTPETDGHDRRRAVRPHEGGRDLPQHRPRRAARHRRARRRRSPTGTSAAPGLDHFVGEHLATSTTRCARWRTSCSRPHIGGATYDTEANHSTLIADGLVTPARRRHAVEPREPRGPDVTEHRSRPPTRSKEQLLDAAQGDAASGARAGHRRATSRRACPTATSCSRRRRSTTSR